MNTSDLLAIAGIAVSVIGIPLAFILARRGRKRPYLRQLVDFDIIASPKDGDFHTGFLRTSSGDPVVKISRTFVAFWNYQGDTIRGSDIVPDDRLRIQLQDGDHALQARVASRSRQQNKLSTDIDLENDGIVYINFDFLDSDDGGVIEVIHQGSTEPELLGTIRGADRGVPRKADLRPEMLEAATKSWIKRLKILPLILRVVLIGFPIFYGLLATLVISWQASRPGTLVDTSKYDLETLIGQRDFAMEVSRVGILTSGFTWVVILGGTAVLTMVSFFLLNDRIRILFPHAIARILESTTQKMAETGSAGELDTTPQAVESMQHLS